MNEDNRKLLNAVARRHFIDGLRHDATRQGAFEKSMWHLDHPVPGTDHYLKPSDHGTGAAAIYASVEVEPLWLKLWRNAAAKLPQTGKAVLAALLVDWRTAPAAKIAGVSRPTVDHWKKQFKKIFAQCFQAWERDFGQK